jgi:molybdate transport system substrate-binding protein
MEVDRLRASEFVRRNIRATGSRSAFLAAATALFLSQTAIAGAETVRVMISGGFSAALRDLAPAYGQQTGDTLEIISGPSMGATAQAIPNRLARGEQADVVIMVGYALDDLIKAGSVVANSRIDLARSPIAMAVRAGAPKPDISTVDHFKQALLNARSIAYSDSASGVYIQNEMFAKLGIADAVRAKSAMIPATPVGEVVARGDAEIGFQQLSELRPVHGIDIVGVIPSEVQKITVFAGGVVANAQHGPSARALLAFLASPAAAPGIAKTGLEPIPHRSTL